MIYIFDYWFVIKPIRAIDILNRILTEQFIFVFVKQYKK